ncbi:MAG: hypothetical protein EOO17_02510 [Chloroflexi bacterium]|nr:MAG: hypothetical protein EOO17_02510 [Chloroflexota bacterium]
MKIRKLVISKFRSVKKNLVKQQGFAKKYTAKKLSFLTVWRRSIAKRLSTIGAKVVKISPPWLRKVGRIVRWPFVRVYSRIDGLLRRRPHRSFRRTRRRDYKRTLDIQGYWSFTNYVRATLWKQKKLFGGLILTYLIITIFIGGIGAQESYANLSSTLKESGGDLFAGNWGKIGSASLLLVTSVTSGLTPNVTQAQSVLGGLAVFFAWLTTIWLLRNVVAGRRVALRDGLYNGGSPILSTVIVGFVLAIQLLPAAIAVLLYTAAQASGLLESGVAAMLFWIGDTLLVLLSLYWLTSTFIALVVVTLPGMYPFQAIKTAGDLVVGRRLRILFRLLWLLATVVVVWALLIIPIIIFDDWIKQVWPFISALPFVPFSILLLSSVTIVFVTSYIYLLYRKVVEDEAGPA